MNRREFVAAAGGGATIALFAGTGALASLPERRTVRVAFLLGEHANVIDTTGPWEVFQDTMLDGLLTTSHPFELYTVAPERKLVTMTGGLRVEPHYSVADAPSPHVIVVPAHRSTPASRDWLRDASRSTDVTMSVCTGAFQLARVGLLDGLSATTHHEFWDAFSEEFPDIALQRGARFVDSGRVATAGGLTSGIDMALHVVARYFGAETAARTARYMEHSSEAWRGGLAAI